jgi:hypothetical protein
MLYQYLQQHQVTKTATDFRARAYKHDIRLVMLNPMGLPVGTWKLIGAFFSNVAFGDMSWADEGVIEASVTISFDYAEFVLI